MVEIDKIYNDSNLNVLKQIDDNSIDFVLTSPPYDNLRNYEGSLNWNFDIFKEVANELYRVLKDGGVIVWVVGDKTENGSETGTSFRQALYFHDLGLNLHDTMIYRKLNYMPINANRYEQEFEYMFCLSKGKPKTFNSIKIPCRYAGSGSWGKSSFYKTDDGKLTVKGKSVIKDTKLRGNIFEYKTGSITETHNYKHPAMFPLELAKDQVISWSNKDDLVLDPFNGSGTTCVVCKELGRHFIGIDIVKEYCDIAEERLSHIDTHRLF